jgi:geranylgeranyl diphosphate synthase, type II
LTKSISSDFASVYEHERNIIELRIRNILKGRKPLSLYEPASYILDSTGKRLRPLLVLSSAKAAGGSYKDAYNAAIAVELLHIFTLVHDDIMDNADKRRSKTTVHKKYDVNTAILVGDILLAVAYEYLLKDAKGDFRKITAAFTKGLSEVCDGQSMDKDFETLKNVTIKDYIKMIEKKTAAMIAMCTSVGSYIGGADDKTIKALFSFGKNLGIAFQIEDDLLDLIGNSKEFGKNVGGDLVEGKKTFLFLKALEKAKGKDKSSLLKIIKNKGVQPDEIPFYKALYEKLGVIADAESEIKRYTKNAIKNLTVLKQKDDAEFFTSLAHSLIKRSK